MATAAEDPSSFLRAIAENPAALAELRRLTLSDDLRALTAEVRELATAQQRTETRFDALIEQVRQLAAAQQRTETRLEELAAAQQGTETRLSSMTELLRELALQMDKLAVAQALTEVALQTLATRSDRDRGTLIELKYARHGHACFADIARRLRQLTPDQIDDILDAAVASGSLDERQARQVRLADLLFRGRRYDDDAEVVLVIEASGVVSDDDVIRAVDRAGLLARAGVLTIPVVAGDGIGAGARDVTASRGAWVILDGHAEPPDAA